MTKRQAEIFALLEPVEWTADVGCDHGVLSLEMLTTNRSRFVLATDISAPSLDKTVNLIKQKGLLDRAVFACCDGLPVDACVNQILIAGMGGNEIVNILSHFFEQNDTRPILVLQPMRDYGKVRKFLNLAGYKIIIDRIIFDKKYYLLLKAVVGEQKLGAQELAFGAIKDSYGEIDYQRWLDEKIAKTEFILAKMSKKEAKYKNLVQFLQNCKDLKGRN